jgi:hypothetical protein
MLSQEKFEKEYRIKPADVPQEPLKIIKNWDFKNKIKWCVEESQDGKTFEAKICYQKYNYSIGFAEKGTLIDIEKTIKLKKLAKVLQEKIRNTISPKFRKYTIKKLQIQYSGDENSIYKVAFESEENKEVTIKYEIVVKAKREKEYSLYELLLDENGLFLEELKFKPQEFLNLEF